MDGIIVYEANLSVDYAERAEKSRRFSQWRAYWRFRRAKSVRAYQRLNLYMAYYLSTDSTWSSGCKTCSLHPCSFFHGVEAAIS